MIKIENSNLDAIAFEYKMAIFNWLKYGKKTKDETKWEDELQIQIESYNDDLLKNMLNYIWMDLGSLIVSEPDELKRKIIDFDNIFRLKINESDENKKSFEDLKDIMENLYKRFFNHTLYKIPGTKKNMGSKEYEGFHYGEWLAKKLNVNVCPYCNRQYTFTVNSTNGKTRPQFDHFHPKSIFPYLALSFYNLVPSCPTCNHLKGEKIIDINPYDKKFGDDYKIRLATKDKKDVRTTEWVLEKNNIDILFSNDNENIKKLVLTEVYNNHIDYVEEIIDKAQAYNSTYYNSLIDSYKGLGKQASEIDRFVWGAYLEDAEHWKRPLSKLTRDILEQLEIK